MEPRRALAFCIPCLALVAGCQTDALGGDGAVPPRADRQASQDTGRADAGTPDASPADVRDSSADVATDLAADLPSNDVVRDALLSPDMSGFHLLRLDPASVPF